jgi:hypothetical protein
MTKKCAGAILIFCVLVGACFVIPINAAACFSWNVFCSDPNNNVDPGDYTIYEIQTSFSPGCRSTYYVSFSHDNIPPDWHADILDEKGVVIPTGVETILSGTVSYLFSLKVTSPSIAVPGEQAVITTHVRATDYYNQDDTIDVITTTTVNGAESAPNPVILSMAGNTTYTINLTWTQSDEAPGDFNRYEVHMSLVPQFTPVAGTWIASITDIGTTEYEVTGLSPETTYYFCIRVWDNDGPPGPFFADSNILEARTRGFNDPPDPVHLNPPEDVTNCDANLSWTQNMDSDFAYYEIHVSTNPGFTPSSETMFGDPITDSAEIASLVTGLFENETHYFKIRVIDSGGLYADSNEVDCKTLDYIPNQLTLDDPYDIDVESMKLTWTQSCVSDFDHYEVHISLTPGISPGPSTLIMNIDNMSINWAEITGLTNDTTYYFCVRHVDLAGNYMDSNEVFGTTLDCNFPRIILTAPYDGEIDVGLSEDIVVTFSEPMDKATVTFTCSPNPTGWTQSWSNGDKIVTYSHSSFDSETMYQVEITNAQDLAGNLLEDGVIPNPWSFTTIDFVSPTIISINPLHGALNVELDGLVIITFSESMDPDSVVFTCNPDPEGWIEIWNVDHTQLTLSHNDFTALTTYTFEITQGTDITGNPLVASSINNPFSFTTGDFIYPYVVNTIPEHGELDVLVTTTISITFSEDMDQQSVEQALTCDFAYTATWNGNTLILTPISELEKSTVHTITISTEAKDLAANQIQEAYSFGFKTESPVETNEAPVVDVNSPDGDTATDSFVILWSASDSDGDSLILNIYYDTDLDPINGKSLIIAHADNTGSHVWDISSIPEGQYYVYITASDGILEAGAYSGLLTISRPSDDTDPIVDDGNTDIKESQEGDSFPWLILWIILAVVLILILIGAMGYKNRKDRPVKIECQSCNNQFTPFNPKLSSADCPKCGEPNQLK